MDKVCQLPKLTNTVGHTEMQACAEKLEQTIFKMIV